MHEITGLRPGRVIFPVWATAVEIAVGSDQVIVLRIRDQLRQKVLLEDNQRIIKELSQSQDAALNIMEDLDAQRREVERVNRSLLDEIEERRRIEAKRAQLAAIVESSQDGVIGMAVDGVVTTWNSGASKLFGVPPERALGQRLGALIVPLEKQPEFEEVLLRCITDEQGTAYEFSRVGPLGRQNHILISISPTRDSQGAIVGSSAIGRDITQRVEMENELARHKDHLENVVTERTNALLRSQEKLRASERLASIGALAAGIAHEINNPIGAITLSAQNALTLEPEQTSIEDLRALVVRVCSKILSNSRRCGLIVKGILQFARKQGSRKWPNEINTIASSAIQLLRESMDIEKVEIICDLEHSLPSPEVNPTEIEQVFLNLLKNSVDALRGSGKVTVRTSSANSSVIVEVSDTGPGIPPDQLQFVFDPFYTTRQHEGGTGLGLSIVHGIVTDHHGTITVESGRGSGTKFTIEFPLVQPPMETASPQKHQSSMRV